MAVGLLVGIEVVSGIVDLCYWSGPMMGVVQLIGEAIL